MAAVTMVGVLRRWLFATPAAQLVPAGDPIADRLRAAVDANANAESDASHKYETRVRAMIDELFLRMKRDGRPHV